MKGLSYIMMDDFANEKASWTLRGYTQPALLGRMEWQQAPLWAVSLGCAHLTHISVHNLGIAAWPGQTAKSQCMALRIQCPIWQKVYRVL